MCFVNVIISHGQNTGDMDEQLVYDSEVPASTSDVELCTCHRERRTNVRVELLRTATDRKTPELVTENDV